MGRPGAAGGGHGAPVTVGSPGPEGCGEPCGDRDFRTGRQNRRSASSYFEVFMRIEPSVRIPSWYSEVVDEFAPLPCTTSPVDFTNDFYRFGNDVQHLCSIKGPDQEPCGHTSIRAHSIPNRLTLSRLVRDNHVITVMPRRRRFDQIPLLEFKSVGRRNATTFGGICSRHDNALFSEIDDCDPDMGNPKHPFLLSYRSALREYHEKVRVSGAFQLAYRKGVEAGTCQSTSDKGCIHGLLATIELGKAQFCIAYKEILDNALETRNWSALVHRHFFIPNQDPTVAVSATTDLGFLGSPTFTLNVLPVEQGTIVLFSTVRQHGSQVFAYVDRILASDSWLQKYLLSKFIIQSCDNFVVHPDYYDDMSEKKRESILTFYGRTAIENDEGYEDEHLFLF